MFFSSDSDAHVQFLKLNILSEGVKEAFNPYSVKMYMYTHGIELFCTGLATKAVLKIKAFTCMQLNTEWQ